jgi:hypothetical protein
MTMTLLNYETSGKNDDQQNKENQDKTNMTSKSKSANSAHLYSLLSINLLSTYTIFFYFGNAWVNAISKSLIL